MLTRTCTSLQGTNAHVLLCRANDAAAVATARAAAETTAWQRRRLWFAPPPHVLLQAVRMTGRGVAQLHTMLSRAHLAYLWDHKVTVCIEGERWISPLKYECSAVWTWMHSHMAGSNAFDGIEPHFSLRINLQELVSATLCAMSRRTFKWVRPSVLQVQGKALLPGAAMFEMAASAASTLALPGVAPTAATLMGVSIPAPLPLTADAAATLLSVTLDATSGRLLVQSQRAAAAAVARTHVTATSGITAVVDVSSGTEPIMRQPAAASKLAALLLISGSGGRLVSGTAVADVQRPATGLAAQYDVHPAVLDNVTQVSG